MGEKTKLTSAESSTNKKEYPPGSEKAIGAGCTCSSESNQNGEGYKGYKGTWAIDTSCKLHYWHAGTFDNVKPNKKNS